MAAPAYALTSVADYLAFEAQAPTKHEYWHGRIIAMAGASEAHNLITSNLVREMGNRLVPKGCRVVSSDLRVSTGMRYTYPDVIVYCQTPVFTGDQPDTLTNPSLLIEVISSSTADRDRSDKLAAYLEIESLHEYWIIEQNRALVYQYVRGEGAWTIGLVRGLEAALRCDLFEDALPMADVYAFVDLPHAPTAGDGTSEDASAD